MKRKIEAMHMRFGIVKNQKCKDCSNFIQYNYRTIENIKKCKCYGVTNSQATDWRIKDIACGLFNKEYEGKQIIDVLKHFKEGVINEQIEGQIKL